jgi:hypothetical protein
MADFVSTIKQSSEETCTFAISRNNLISQAIYICQTCTSGELNNICCCSGCSKICHADHDVSFVAYGKAYCDCGCSGCLLFRQSLPLATNVVSHHHSNGLILQDDGRIGGTVECGLVISPFNVHKFNEAFFNPMALQSLNRQCNTLVSLSKETFWLGDLDEPRCELEFLAKTIYNYHTYSVDKNMINREVSGLEWWIQLKSNADSDKGGDDINMSDGVDLHYDKDEELAANFGIGVFPQISTVTVRFITF